MNGLNAIKSWRFSSVILYGSLLCVGVFHEYLSCALSVVLLVWLAVTACRKRALTVSVNATSGMMAVLVLGYAVSSFWAIDSGTAVFGFFKFFPVLLYALVLTQQEDGRQQAVAGLPYAVTAMTVAAIIAMQIPALTELFSVQGRFAGFLQYPNTYALVMLVAQLLLLTKRSPRWWDFACMAVLLFGIVYTGSRTVLVLTVIGNVVGLFLAKNRALTWTAIGCIATGAAVAVGYCAVSGDWWLIDRLTAISVADSQFVGRLLYVFDMLPTLATHPFGLGYMGYHYLQQSVQTGVYSVMYLHNDVLQIALDIGWVPCLVFVGAMGRSLLSKTVSGRYKLVLGVMLAHCLFDFDLQYIAVFMMLILFTDHTPWRSRTTTRVRGWVAGAAVLCVVCGYFGAVSALARFERYAQADAWYPAYTKVDVALLQQETDPVKMGAIADEILARNEYVAVAYSAKARQAYAKGDFEQVIRYKHKVFALAPFERAEYQEYAEMMAAGLSLYRQAGDTASADVCKRELLSINDRMRAAKQKVGKLGSQIATQPNLYFSTEMWEYIQHIAAEDD